MGTKNKRESLFLSISWDVVLVYLILVVFGLLNIYSSSCGDNPAGILNVANSRHQAVFMMISLAVAFFVLLLDGNFFKRAAYGIYGFTTLMLILVLIIGTEVAGAKSWFTFGGFSIQASEFAKIGTALAFSRYVGENGYFGLRFSKKLIIFGMILLSIGLILLEPDAGSAMVFLSFIIPLFREGFPMGLVILALYFIALAILSLVVNNYILLGAVFLILTVFVIIFRRNKGIIINAILIFVVSVVVTFSVVYVFENKLPFHQHQRIAVLLGLSKDTQGAGYNINQSKIAIGSGSLWGKGFLNGIQTKMDFVPESHTDFIFCTVGEEWGFAGCFGLILLYLYLFIKLMIMAERQRTRFSRVYGYSVLGIFFFHVMINICMTIGLMPVIGIPLPFMSYGGSSLLAFTILLFIFIKLDAYRYSILS